MTRRLAILFLVLVIVDQFQMVYLRRSRDRAVETASRAIAACEAANNLSRRVIGSKPYGVDEQSFYVGVECAIFAAANHARQGVAFTDLPTIQNWSWELWIANWEEDHGPSTNQIIKSQVRRL